MPRVVRSVSTERIRRLAATGVAALVVLAGAAACDRLDGMWVKRSDPRLLVEGSEGGARWAVVLIHERGRGDCLELRHGGVAADRACDTAAFLGQYTLGVTVLRGTSVPVVFGVLPEGTARAEVALDGATFLRREPERPMAPVEVRTFGENGRYVAEPAPAARKATGEESWRDSSTVNVEAYDANDRRLAPPQSR